MKLFYKNAKRLDELKRLENPGSNELAELLSILRDDEALAVYFYEQKGSGFFANPSWLPMLKEAGEFDDLAIPIGGLGFVQRVKAGFLVEMGREKPEEVLEILSEVNTDDNFVQYCCIDALKKMLERTHEHALRGIWLLWRCLRRRDVSASLLVSHDVGELMVQILDHDTDLAFATAEMLFEIWRSEDKGGRAFRDVAARFDASEYSDLMFKYYSRLWAKHPLRAARLLVLILDRYIEVCSKEKDFDVNEHFYIGIDNLEDIDRVDRDLVATLVGAICLSGREVLSKGPVQIDAMFRLLRRPYGQIFLRIEMFLLRFVPPGTYCSRISEIIGNKEYFDRPAFRHEYNLLLRDRGGDISEEAKAAFVGFIEEMGVSDVGQFAQWFEATHGRKHTQVDLNKYEDRIRAARLYSAHERFAGLYNKYRQSAGATDVELMPRPRHGGFETCPSLIESAPISVEDMLALGPQRTIDYLLDPVNYEAKREAGVQPWHTPNECIAAVFREVARRTPVAFIKLGYEALNRLGPDHFAVLLDSVCQAVRAQGAVEAEGAPRGDEFWDAYLALAHHLVQEHGEDSSYRGVSRAVLDTLREGFGDGPGRIDLKAERVVAVWEILECLLDTPAHGDSEDRRDPVQQRCSSVPGMALELLVWLARKCKHWNEDSYVNTFRRRLEESLGRVLDRFQGRPEVLCTLGIEFPGLFWLSEDWVRGNLARLFSAETRDITWGTYVSWGRPWRPAFEFLVAGGFYREAIDRIGQKMTYEYGKALDQGLTEHLVIAYFNGWLKISGIEVWEYFLERAPDELRAHAAGFMATGFESPKGEGNEESIGRIRSHWKKRLQVISADAGLYQQEARSLVAWVEHSPLPPRETLELTAATLERTQGKPPQRGGINELVKRICHLAEGNELMALRCIRMLVGNEQGAGSLYEDHLQKLLERIVSLKDPQEGVVKEGIELVDELGRHHQYQYRPYYEALAARLS